MTLKCYGCGKVFVWTAEEEGDRVPAYHNETCKRKARRRRSKAEQVICPRPEKRKFSNHSDAEKAANALAEDTGEYLNVYRCICGGLHIGRPKVISKEDSK